MSAWDEYPEDYRAWEVQAILKAARAGECISVVGLSGSGKSNLLGFVAQRFRTGPGLRFVLVDCNRLEEPAVDAFLRLVWRTLEGGQASVSYERGSADKALAALETAVEHILAESGQKLCLLLDRFDVLTGTAAFPMIASNLRALRDAFKYQLCYVTATRHALDAHTELAELFFRRTLWLGPLSSDDARWSARRDLQRLGVQGWNETTLERLVELTWGYPSLLRAGCEALADGFEPLTLERLSEHSAVQQRVAEFWADGPRLDELQQAKLTGQPLLGDGLQSAHQANTVDSMRGAAFDRTVLTAKENLLLGHLMAHTGQVCEKDDLIRAIWPEDVIFEQGIRDESLAQLVRRLRVKVETNPAEPKYIHTVPGRGYMFRG